MTNNKTNNLKIISIGHAYPLRGGISNFNVALSYAFNNNDKTTRFKFFTQTECSSEQFFLIDRNKSSNYVVLL